MPTNFEYCHLPPINAKPKIQRLRLTLKLGGSLFYLAGDPSSSLGPRSRRGATDNALPRKFLDWVQIRLVILTLILFLHRCFYTRLTEADLGKNS